MPTHKSSDYKLSAVKYYVQTCKIFGCSERSLMIKRLTEMESFKIHTKVYIRMTVYNS